MFYQCFTIKSVVEYSLNFLANKLSFKCSFYFILISWKFYRLQNSSHEALTQSFQLAFSLRSISLNENGRALIPILFNVCMLLCLHILVFPKNERLNTSNVCYGWISYQLIFKTTWFLSQSSLLKECLVLKIVEKTWKNNSISIVYSAKTGITPFHPCEVGMVIPCMYEGINACFMVPF